MARGEYRLVLVPAESDEHGGEGVAHDVGLPIASVRDSRCGLLRGSLNRAVCLSERFEPTEHGFGAELRQDYPRIARFADVRGNGDAAFVEVNPFPTHLASFRRAQSCKQAQGVVRNIRAFVLFEVPYGVFGFVDVPYFDGSLRSARQEPVVDLGNV